MAGFRQLSSAQALAEANRHFTRLPVAMVVTATLLFLSAACSGCAATAPPEARSTAGEHATPAVDMRGWHEEDTASE